MNYPSTHAVPEQGQLVEVRQLRYAVVDVAQSTQPATSYIAAGDHPQHLLTLASVEDDALGEELEVIWELEPGARILDDVNLPELVAFDRPHRLDAFLDAVRWCAVSSADVRALQAPFRSGVDIEDYQLDPLVRAIQMPRVNLLIADDVGLGKTVEAGLVLQELIIRHRARRVLIVCPAGLQIHWRDQMLEKFGLDFRIVDSALMKTLRRERGLHVNPWTHFPRLITSIDFLKRDRPMRLLREVLPAPGEPIYPRKFDLLIVDEAHNVAPSGGGRYAVDSQRTLAVRTLTPHFEHRLFLTATPHNGYKESFTALLELIDNQRFARGIEPDEAQKRAIMVRRLKSELPPRWDGSPRFPQRQLLPIEVAYTAEERQVHAWLQEYTRLRRQHIQQSPQAALFPANGDSPAELANQQKFALEFVLKLLKKRLFSSPAAFALTLEQHARSLRGEKTTANTNPLRRLTTGILRQLIDQAEEEFGEDEAYETAMHETLATADQLLPPLTPQEEALLHKMTTWAQSAMARPDSKTQELIRWLHHTLKPGGVWSNERVILFTEYRTTQNWLQTLLAAAGFTGGGRLRTLYGGMPTAEREAIKTAFLAHPDDSPVRILLATDAASEGIDLQRHCHRLIHLEIPWNPNRLEQRNGRIDRHGQRHNPQIYHFVGQGYQQQLLLAGARDELDADLEFLLRVAVKVDQIREDLGSVGAVIADQVTAAMLGGERILDTGPAERRADPVRKQLKFERDLHTQIERLRDQLHESRQTLRLNPENVQAVVAIALELAGQPPLEPTDLPGVWPDPSGRRSHCPVYQLPALTGSWARCAVGVTHPYTGLPRPITFDHTVASGRDDVVLVHLNHLLVQLSVRLLRAEVWAHGAQRRLHRATARLVPNQVLATPALIAHARLVMIGGDSHRLHEEIITVGGEIVEGRFRRLGVTQIQEALAAATDAAPPPPFQQRLLDLWPTLKPGLLRALEVRSDERAASLANFLAERSHKETSDIRTILAELARTIEAELAAPAYTQLELELWPKSERDQLVRNEAALHRRLAEIPAEVAQETARIAQRYANPQARLFPVAISFLIPEKLAH